MLALALTGAGAFLSGNNLLFLIFAALMAVLMVSGFISRLSLAGLELELLLPKNVSAREPTPARVKVRNLKRFSASLSIELSGRDSILAAPVYFPVIAGRGSVETGITVVFPKRGIHRGNLFLLSTRFPFGFIRRSARVTLRHETLVFPSVVAPAGVTTLPADFPGDAEGRVRGSGTDLHQIRPWVTDDDARMTDWKSTARTGSVHIREFGRDEQQMVELWFDRRIDGGQEQRFEWLVDYCAYVGWELVQQGKDVRLHLADSGEEYSGIYAILGVLALIQPSLQPLDAESSPTRGLKSDRGSQVIFSTRPRTDSGIGLFGTHMMDAQE